MALEGFRAFRPIRFMRFIHFMRFISPAQNAFQMGFIEMKEMNPPPSGR